MSYTPVPVTFLPATTLIVPMDSAFQNNGMYKAYGLIFRLLYENIINTNVNYKPIYVYWAINPTKTTLTTVDFTATTKGYNTSDPVAARQYSGGPFIIQSDDLAYVKTLINTWNTNNTPVVTIHELVDQVTIDTAAKLIRPPRIAVEDTNNSIVRAYLNAAGLPDYYVLSGAYGAAPVWTSTNTSVLTSNEINTGAFFRGTVQSICRKLGYDIFISPHTDEKTWTDLPATLPNLDQFIRLGGVLHSMCASIEAIENNAKFLTISGINAVNQGTSFFINTAEATNPLLQAVSTTNPQALPGGSVQTWQNSLTTYKTLTKIFAYFIRNAIQYDFMVGGKYQGSTVYPGTAGAGAVIYEGGHQYTNSTPYTGNPENMYTKFVLNSIFLSVTKPFIDLIINPNSINAGASNNLTFTIKNLGGAQAKNATISINLLSGMIPSNFSIAPTSIIGDTITWSNITLDGGQAITFDVLNYTPGSPGTFPITFSATYGDEIFATGQNPYELNACSALTIVPSNSPFLSVEKRVNGNFETFIESGDSVVFTYTITNSGDQPAYDIELVDPNLFDYFNFGLINVIPTPASIDTINKKIVFKTTPDPQAVVIPPAQNAPNNVLTVTVNAAHKGNVVVPPDEIINVAQVNYVNRFPDPDVPLTSPNSNRAITNIVLPDISAIKSVDKTNAAIGDILKYKIDITNTGNTLIKEVKLTDLIPTGTSYIPGTLNVTTENISPTPNITAQYIAAPSPGRIEVIVTGDLEPVGATPGTFTDKITVEFNVQVNSIPPNPVQNHATVDYTYIIESPDTGTITGVNSNTVETNIASLQLIKAAPAFVRLGENLTYTITLTNNGKVPLTNVKLVDTIPNGTNYISSTGATFISQVGQIITLQVASIPVNATANVTITVAVNTLPPAPYTITNNISAIYTVDGVEKPPVSDSETTNVIQGIITVDKGTEGNIIFAKVGDTIPYKVDITNTGNVPVTLTNLTDVIQQIGFTTPSATNMPLNIILQPGQSTTISYNVLITALPPDKKIDNTVTVSFAYQVGQETYTEQMQDSFTLNVEEIKVSLTKAVNKTFAEPGEEVTYTFTINNQSSVPITNVYLYDPLPADTTFVSGSFSLNPEENPVQFPGAFIGTIPNNSQVVVSFKIRINPNLIASVNIPDTGSVTYNFKLNPNEPGPGQPAGPVNSNQVNTKVEIAKIEILKTVSNQYAETGDILSYTLTVKNTGTVNAYDVEITDILSPFLQFVPGSLIVTPQQAGDTITGTDPSYIKVNIIRANPNAVIIQFNAKVISRPPSGKVDNIAYGNFKYSLDPQLPPALSKTNIPSNIVSTIIQEIKVELLKTSNSNYVEVGQNLTYTVTISNKSTVPVNIKFTDTLPAVTQYVTGSFNLISGSATIINNTLPDSNLIDLDINNIQPQSSVIFSYKVKILTLPSPPAPQEITNAASAVPSYSLFPGGPIREGVPVTDEVTTEVKLIKIDVIKSVEESIATIGDILHYTVLIINNGNTAAKNVVFSDNVPEGTEFVDGSFTVNGSQVNSTLDAGTVIGTIAPGEIVTIKFNVKVAAIPNPPKEPIAENVALVTFDVELDGQLQPRDPVNSNKVETDLVKVQLEAVKTVDKTEAEVGDFLTYTVVIKNTGNITIDNVIFNDVIPEGTILVGNQPVQNINLGSIAPGESKTITFKVQIVSKPCPPKLVNIALIKGTFIIETQRSLTIESNEAVTYVGVKAFKQISVDENLTIPDVKPDVEEILEVIADVVITYTNVIKTPVVTSYEGQQLTGWKLIVEGKLKQKIVYIADEPAQSVHAAEFDIPFSTFLVLSKDYKKCQRIKVEGIIEDVFVRLINKRTIFKNVTLMLQGKLDC
ncbi:DUF3794 domain-containing protein [Clostridium sp. SYSU_GA19001]|uniref:DUF7507 domain-containing protein n=1 Tax=Clostridium caldaquaticum TaxID=2940653 RepID=UPI0020779B95|nr:SPOCS domain-containing protein [Clostridium caldaquaticum]MCM8709596.1 DUF3794 domain-containing protein [Clostridium caldaquaticum]